MIELGFALRKTIYSDQGKVGLYIAQQKLIKVMLSHFQKEWQKESAYDKLLDCSSKELERIYQLYLSKGVEPAAEALLKIKQSKTKS